MQNDINNDSSIRVMIVDDQKAARFGLSLLVKKAADMHVMVSATNGQEAIEVLSRMKEANDLLPPSHINGYPHAFSEWNRSNRTDNCFV